jgi:serine phosphatase RsbU (regulator of sigma subunit)/CHASE2 domain-containing sensor protein
LRITWIRFAFAALVGIIFAFLAFRYHWYKAVDRGIYDLGLEVRPGIASESDIVIVALDKYSRQNAYPPPEFPVSAHVDEHAMMIERLNEAGARAIALDILFDQIDPGLDVGRFVTALEGSESVCLAAAIEKVTLGTRTNGADIEVEHLVVPVARIPEDHYCTGLVNMPVDADLAVRRSSRGAMFQGNWIPSMPVVLAEAFGKNGSVISKRQEPFYIDYRFVSGGLATIPYIDVLNTDGWQELVRDRIVLIGVTENSLSDVYEMPITGIPGIEHGNKLPGALILAYATQTLIGDSLVEPLAAPYGLLLGVVMAILASLTALRKRLVLSAGLALAAIIGMLTIGVLLPAMRITILPSGLLLSVMLLTAVAGLAINYIHTRFRAGLQERELAEISTDLQKAAAIQQRLQPASMPEIEGVEVAGFQIACKAIGGDYYDVVELGDGKLGLLIADVCGKGISAAMLMSNLQSNFHQLAPTMTSTSQLVINLNTIASQVFSEGRFVTLLYAILDVANRRMAYCSAGHMPPMVCHSDGSLEQLERGGIPIGPFPEFDWKEHTADLQSGDLVFMYTDGLSEATNPKTEEMYDEERIRKYLKENHEKSPDELIHDIVRAAQDFSRSEHLDDDITLLSFRVL